MPPSGLAATSDYAFLVENNSSNRGSKASVQVYALASTTPEMIAEVALDNASRLQVAPNGNLLAVETDGSGFRWSGLPTKGGLHLFDIHNPAQPREMGKMNVPPGGWFLTDNYLLGLKGDTLTLYDLNDPRFHEVGRWRYVPRENSPYNSTTLTINGVVGTTVFLGVTYDTGITQLDISEPGLPTVIGVLPAYYNLQVLGQRGELLYTLDTSGGEVSVWDMSRPDAPARLGTPPSPVTIGYMKRRARRLLHRLGTTDPAQYVRITGALLAESGLDEAARSRANVSERLSKLVEDENHAAPPLNLSVQWVTADALFGGTNAYVQMSHGRGNYVLAKNLNRRIQIRRRDERFPDAWDAHPGEAARLLNAPHAAPGAYALAVRVLRAGRTPLPPVTDFKAIGTMLASDTPLLQSIGARSAVALVSEGKRLPGGTTALAFVFATPQNRAAIIRSLDANPGGAKWNRQFASALLAQVTDAWENSDGNVRLLRRVLPGVALLAERFADTIDADQILPLAPALLLSRRADFTRLVARLARATSLNLLYRWVDALSSPALTDTDREPVLVALEEAVATMQSVQILHSTVISDGEARLHPVAWRLLAASNSSVEGIAALWRLLLDRPTLTPALQSAMASPYALRLLTMANLPADEISARLQSRTFLAPLLSEDTFQQMVQTAPVASLLTLAGSLDDATFVRLRTVWLRMLREGVGAPALWSALPDALKTDENGLIAARILNDTEIAASLADLPPENVDLVLAVHDPLMDDLVTRWAARHPTAFPRDSELLTQAATSPLSRFRAWGLARTQALGLDLPVALRLMESDLPDALAVGRTFFETVNRADKESFDYGLALCDSPARAVRRYGREFITTRWEMLPHTEVYTALFESSDPEVRQWIAKLLGHEPDPNQGGIDTSPFDRDVLRSRDTGRAAKEMVKTRVARTGTVDTETLLSLARGTGTPRDAEWALTQLARRALAGEVIAGFSVDGVAG